MVTWHEEFDIDATPVTDAIDAILQKDEIRRRLYGKVERNINVFIDEIVLSDLGDLDRASQIELLLAVAAMFGRVSSAYGQRLDARHGT